MVRRMAWLVLLWLVIVACACPSCGSQYSNPTSTLTESELVGVWKANYLGSGSDTLDLRADRTFKQVYIQGRYRFETPWNQWSLERFSDGRVQIRLRGARYYCRGTDIAERGGMEAVDPAKPDFFWDPIGQELTQMPGQLVLNVQRVTSGELVLVHMLMSIDEGFTSIWSGEAPGTFHRPKAP